MKIAITGGTGFIGRLLVDLHQKRGDTIKILSRNEFQNRPGIEYITGSLLDESYNFNMFVDDVDILYHCAGQLHDESLMEETHIHGMMRLLKASTNKIKRWVQLSSVGVYEKCKYGVVDEHTPVSPVGTYESTKAIADSKLIEYATKHKLDYTILRPSNVFGPQMSNQSLSSLIKMIKKGLFFYIGEPGSQANYISVDDVVNALFLCATHPLAKSQIFNLSQTITVEAMINSLSEGYSCSPPKFRVPEWPLRRITKMMENLSFFPLSTSRIDALTTHRSFSSVKIIEMLDFSFQNKLSENFYTYSKILSDG